MQHRTQHLRGALGHGRVDAACRAFGAIGVRFAVMRDAPPREAERIRQERDMPEAQRASRRAQPMRRVGRRQRRRFVDHAGFVRLRAALDERVDRRFRALQEILVSTRVHAQHAEIARRGVARGFLARLRSALFHAASDSGVAATCHATVSP